MTPYQRFANDPFPRNRPWLEKLFDAIQLNRLFLREGKRAYFQPDHNKLIAPAESKIADIQCLKPSHRVFGKSTLFHGQWYSFQELTHNAKGQSQFENGIGINFYLNPLNLHYLLFPCDLAIASVDYAPNFCWPILFIRKSEIHNERIILHAVANNGTPLVIIMIGSLFVAGIECLAKQGKTYKRDGLMGGFKLGSTVVMLFPQNSIRTLVKPSDKLCLGEPFAEWL